MDYQSNTAPDTIVENGSANDVVSGRSRHHADDRRTTTAKWVAEQTARHSMHVMPRVKIELRNVLNRVWPSYFTTAEHALLSRIFDLTIEWGRMWVSASIEQLANGLPSRDWGKSTGYSERWPWEIPPLGASPKTIQRRVKELEERKVLRVKIIPNKVSVFALNTSWKPTPDIRSMLEYVQTMTVVETKL